MHASTLLPTLLLTLSPLTLAKPLPPQSTDGPHRRGSPLDAPAPQFTHPPAKELSDLAATLNDIAARLAIPPPDVLGSTEHQPSSSDDDDDDYDYAAPSDLGVGNLDGIEGLNGASLLPDNTFAPRDPSPSTKQDDGTQQTDPPRVKARHDGGGEVDDVVEGLRPDRAFVPRGPSPTDKQTGNQQTDPPHRLLAALKTRHGGEGEGAGHGVAAPLEDAPPASEESDDEGDDESEGYDDDDEEAGDPFTELSGADAPTYAAPNRRQSGHRHGAAAAGTNPLDTTTGLGFPATGGRGGDANPIDIANLGIGGSGGLGRKKRTAQDLSSLASGLGQLGGGDAGGLTDGLSSGLGNAGGLPGADGLAGLGKVVPGLGGGAAARRKRRGVGWAA